MSLGDGPDTAQLSVRGRREGFCLHGLSLGLDEAAGAPSLSQCSLKHATSARLTGDPYVSLRKSC